MDIVTNSRGMLDNGTFSTEAINTNYKSNDTVVDIFTAHSVLAVQSTVAFVGIVANLTVIVVFLNHKKLRRKIPNMFIINQSFADMFSALMLLLNSLTLKDITNTKTGGVLGYVECSLWNTGFLIWGGFLVSTWNLVCLTVERYLGLVHPIWHRTHFKLRYIYISIALVWVFGVGINAAYMIPTATVVDGVCRVSTLWPSGDVKAAFGIVLIFIQFFAPVMVLIICYGKIVWVLTRRINTDVMKSKPATVSSVSSSTANTGTISADTAKDKFQLARRNTIKTLLIVACCFIICWSQNQIWYLMFNFGYDMDFNSTYHVFTIFMVFLNCIINPFIYLLKYKDYQEALKTLFHCSKEQRKNNSLNSSLDRSRID